jgi:hypothetical protein
VIGETDNMELFERMSVNIIIEKAWKEHRIFFITFFIIPFLIWLLSYFVWVNWFSDVELLYKMGLERQRGAIALWILIVVFSVFFFIQEVYQFLMGPSGYIKDPMNLWEVILCIISLISPTFCAWDIYNCGINGRFEYDTSLCEHGLLKGQPFSAR